MALTFGMSLLFGLGFSTPASAEVPSTTNCKLVDDEDGQPGGGGSGNEAPNVSGANDTYLFQYNDDGSKNEQSRIWGSGTYYFYAAFPGETCVWRADYVVIDRPWNLESTTQSAREFGANCRVGSDGKPVIDGALDGNQLPISGDFVTTYPGYACRYSVGPGGANLEEVIGIDPPTQNGGTPSGGGTPTVAPVLETENIENLGNGLAWYALAAAVTGIFISAALWALGSKGQNPGQELTGKRGIIVCLAAAFAVGGLNPFMTRLSEMANELENTSISTPAATPRGEVDTQAEQDCRVRNPNIPQEDCDDDANQVGGGTRFSGGGATEGSLDN